MTYYCNLKRLLYNSLKKSFAFSSFFFSICILFSNYLERYRIFYFLFPLIVFFINFLYYYFYSISINKNFLRVNSFFGSKVYDFSKWDLQIIEKNSRYFNNCYIYLKSKNNSRLFRRINISNFDYGAFSEINLYLVDDSNGLEHNNIDEFLPNSYHFDIEQLKSNIKSIRSKKILRVIIAYLVVSNFLSIVFFLLNYENDLLIFSISIFFCLPFLFSYFRVIYFYIDSSKNFISDIIFGSCLLIDDKAFYYDDIINAFIVDSIDSYGYTCRKLCIISNTGSFDFCIDYFKDFSVFHFYSELYIRFNEAIGSRFIVNGNIFEK